MKNIVAAQVSYCFRSSPFGPVAVIWSTYSGHPKIYRVVLSKPGLSAIQMVEATFSGAISSSCSVIDNHADQIEAFLRGNDVRFSLGVIRLDLCSKFQQKVLRAEHGIPRGFVSTYQRIAKYLGEPFGARAVGTALATNPFPVIIPCHRAVHTDRTLGGYQGGHEMKRALLEMEGIGFDEAGCVATENVFY